MLDKIRTEASEGIRDAEAAGSNPVASTEKDHPKGWSFFVDIKDISLQSLAERTHRSRTHTRSTWRAMRALVRVRP